MATCLAASITADEDHIQMIRGMGRIYGPVLGPFESYMTMRGIKTFPLAYGTSVPQRLPSRELACVASESSAGVLSGRSEASRRGDGFTAAARRISMARWSAST